MREKVKKISVKRIMLFAIAMIMSFVCICSTYPVQQVEAKTWTKSSVKKELKSTNAKLTKVKAKYKKAKAAYNKANKGTFSVLGASVLSYNPLVIYYEGILGINTGYYWIDSGKENFSTIGGIGTLKTTGEYRTYNGYTCTVVKAVKLANASKVSKYDKQLKTLRSRKTKLNHALKNVAMVDVDYLYSNYGEEFSYIIPGEEYDISKCTFWKYSDEKYSDFIYKSSNKSIATIDENGILTAKKPGTVTITVKASISGKTKKTKIIIKNAQESDSSENLEAMDSSGDTTQSDLTDDQYYYWY